MSEQRTANERGSQAQGRTSGASIGPPPGARPDAKMTPDGWTFAEARERKRIIRALTKAGWDRVTATKRSESCILAERFLDQCRLLPPGDLRKEAARMLQAQRLSDDVRRAAFPPRPKRDADAAFRDAR